MAVPVAHSGRPRTRQPGPGETYRVEIRLPEADAAVLYAAARDRNSTISAMVAALIGRYLSEGVVGDDTP